MVSCRSRKMQFGSCFNPRDIYNAKDNHTADKMNYNEMIEQDEYNATKKTLFRADNLRPIKAKTLDSAANIFADRIARAKYGKSGYCRICRLNSWSSDGRSATYQLFIGHDGSQIGTTVGRNIWITVYAD